MANRDRREALRGAGEETLDVLAEVLTSEQWAKFMRAPLEHAAARGNRGLAQKLVGAGAEIGDALHEAVRGGHSDVVNDLLESGASVAAKDTSGYGNTPLHLAAGDGKTELVQLLLLKGADKDALDNNADTPLYLAAFWGEIATALALLAAGADVSLQYGDFERTILHGAAEGGHVDILRAAIERGADVDAIDSNQSAPFHVAATSNNVEAIDVLVEAGANIEARDGAGSTPLHLAVCESSLEAMLALLKHGVDVNAQDNNQETPLHWAAGKAGTQGAAEVVDSLLRSGADETILNDEGRAAADVVGEEVEEEDQLAEDVDRMRQLLGNAPADRGWRRRGYLVLCRAHPDRLQQMHIKSSSTCVCAARRTRSSAKLANADTGSCNGTAGGSTVDGQTGGDWAALVARVLGVEEEGIFRSIVGYL